MASYSVTKNYGHFRQVWHLEAESDEDAWNRAEIDGVLKLQPVYRERVDSESRGYVVNLDKKEPNIVTAEEHREWMREAITLGMRVTPYEFEKAFGKREEE